MIELPLRQGIEKTIILIEKKMEAAEKPILVAAYGMPDSGKTYMIDEIVGHFRECGRKVSGDGGGPKSSTFEMIKEGYTNEIHLFHCAWLKYLADGRKAVSQPHEDPDVLAEAILGRGINLDIGIYSPFFDDKLGGDYDLLISNPGSGRKAGRR